MTVFMTQTQVEQIVQQVTEWARSHQHILAVALVGSQARGTAHAESDIDLMLLSEQPLLFKASTDWLSEIDWGTLRIRKWEDITYGAVWSRHVYLHVDDAGCVEVELSFGQPSWASIAPIDPGTQHVVRGGCRVLYDADEHLTQLVQFVSAQG